MVKLKTIPRAEGQSVLKHLFFPVVMVIAVFFCYGNTFDSPFLFDDVSHIPENNFIKVKDLSFSSLTEAAIRSPSNRRLLPNLSFALNYYFNGLNVQGYHYVNILIHIACGISLYFLFLQTLSLPVIKEKITHPREIAQVSAFLWLVHPLQTNGVTYIVQRMTSMAALFFILSMLFYIIARFTPSARKRILLFAASGFAGILAILSKENAVMLPVMIFAFEFFFFNGRDEDNRKRFFASAAIVFAVCSFLIVIFYFKGRNPMNSILGNYEIRDFTLAQRLLTEPRVIFKYLSILILPLPSMLNLNHDVTVFKSLLDPVTTIAAIAGILIMAAGVVLLFRRNRLLSFALFWFLGNHLIESSLIPLEIMYEHRMYLPAMFLFPAAIAFVYEQYGSRGIPLRGGLWIAAIILMIFTWQRNTAWQSEISFWTDVTGKSPDLARAHTNLGEAYVKKGKYSEAEKALRRAITLDPGDGNAHLNLATALEKLNRLDEAMKHADIALTTRNANLAKIHQVRGIVLVKQQKLPAAIAEMEEALSLTPFAYPALVNMGMAYGMSGKHEKAEEYFRRAMSVEPGDGSAYLNLGICLEAQNRLNEAAEVLKHGLSIARTDKGIICAKLGVISVKQGKRDYALTLAKRARSLAPNHPETRRLFQLLSQTDG